MIAPDDPAQALDAIVEEAFRVLPAHALTDLGVCGCPVCMSIEDQASAARTDRREIPDEMVGTWLGSAKGDDNLVSVEVAEHLGPRLLMFVRDDPDLHGVEFVLDAVRFGDRDRWPGERGAFLDRAALAILDRLRGNIHRGGRLSGTRLDDTLCMLARGGFAVAPLLARIEVWPDRDLVRRLWADWVGWCRSPYIRRTAFWEDERVKDPSRAVGAWYVGPAVRAKVDRFLEITPTDDPDWDRAADVEAVLATATR